VLFRACRSGFETAAELASRGAAVVLACRRLDVAEDAAAAIRCAPGCARTAARDIAPNTIRTRRTRAPLRLR
jgi:NAD(P)-dependent dehydrogenase (short-subunit alcohol dehydrogenase family)